MPEQSLTENIKYTGGGQRFGADGIVDERAKVVDMRSDPLARH